MHRVEALLRKEIGLDAASIGSPLIERTIRRRMKQHGLKHPEEYAQLLRQSRAEFDELIEAIVVTETWFFRDREPFRAFTQFAVAQLRARPPGGILRILSVPCSSGEEPYSLAMALLDAAVATERFQIDAVDISTTALQRAARANYGKNSFRGPDLEFRDRHFAPVPDGYVLNHQVRRHVTFARDNLLDENFLVGAAPYDFIFCRNLLIYFDRATQILALAKLHRLLARTGVLFVGPAEVPLVNQGGFTSINLPHTFACHKTNPTTAPAPRRRRRNQQLLSGPMDAGRRTADNGRLAMRETALQPARELADAGCLAEAAALCQAHLLHHDTSAEAYYLLGLVKDAANDPDAITYYRRALYLEPNHYEALVHAALYLAKTGATAAAQTLKRRAARVQPKP